MVFVVVVLAILAMIGIQLVVTLPSVTRKRAGKALVFVLFFLVPLLVTGAGTSAHLKRARSTQFCLSCHEMGDHGESLRIDDPKSLPAAHFQNKWIPREEACYACHAEYTLFGDARAKVKGLEHLWVHFKGAPKSDEIKLYEPFLNRECLRCHDGARNYEALTQPSELLADLKSGETSCLECHDSMHDVGSLAERKLWTSGEAGQ